MNITITLILLCALELSSGVFCPDHDLIAPCTCEMGEMWCVQIDDANLTRVFLSMNERLTADQKHYKVLNLFDSTITTLNENAFKDITFEAIMIFNAKNLFDIHLNAFNTTDSVTQVLRLYNNTRLTQLANNTLFDILSKFTNAVTIELRDNGITEIEDQAFKDIHGLQTSLKQLIIIGKSVAKLGNNAFKSIPKLKQLFVESTDITELPTNAFTFDASNETLELFLTWDLNLTRDSFANKSLLNIERPALLFVGQPYVEKVTMFLDEVIYMPFLAHNDGNGMDGFGQLIDCNDCRNQWLTKDEKVLQRVNNFLCSNGLDIRNETNFAKCETYL